MMTTTIDPAEAAHFGRLAADWWNPKGSSAMLHRLNPARLAFIREEINSHWQAERATRYPLKGRHILDVGCGAGLLCEPLARMGGLVTGVDAAAENVAAADHHAKAMGLDISYRHCEVASLIDEPLRFDLITSMEVIEHVTDPAGFVQSLCTLLKPDGLLLLSTPNRTAASKLAMITVGEGLNLIPPGTHDWNKFLTPDALKNLLSDANMVTTRVTGLSFSPARGFVLSNDLSLNYLISAQHKQL